MKEKIHIYRDQCRVGINHLPNGKSLYYNPEMGKFFYNLWNQTRDAKGKHVFPVKLLCEKAEISTRTWTNGVVLGFHKNQVCIAR